MIIIIVVVVLVLLFFVFQYNGLVRLRNRVDNAWSQIDVQLKRRHDLIPNLIETGEGLRRARAGHLREGRPGPQRGDERAGARSRRPRPRTC